MPWPAGPGRRRERRPHRISFAIPPRLCDNGRGAPRPESPMTEKKTLPERERELQARMRAPGGQAELEALASEYAAAGGVLCGDGLSPITCILVHERETGLIRP